MKANVAQTRLSIFCDRLIEAGWLAAVIIVPLYFNIYLERVFETGKASLLRSIALVMSLAWLIGTIEKRKDAGARETEINFTQRALNFLASPLVLPVLALAGVYLLTSITSVWPRVSFGGSYRRFQGTYTTLSYIAIFFLIRHILRAREQMERLVALIVLTSLPVALYGLFQHYGFDPIPWGMDIAERVISAVGNAISVSAYLIMVVPLTIRQLLGSVSQFRASHKERAARMISALIYLLILVVQLLCILFTQSRGPFLGLVGGLFLFFLLWAVSKGNKWLGLIVIGLAVVMVLFLAVLNLPNTPLAALQKFPFIGRLSTIVGGESLQLRALFWEGAVNMSLAQPLRAIVGYGPETMAVAYYPYVSPELVESVELARVTDRCHNATLDALVTTGLVGLLAYFLLFGSLLYYGLKWSGLITSSRQRKLFIALAVAGGVLGLWLPWQLADTLKFAGLGIPFGMLTALVVYLVTCLFRARGEKGQGGGLRMLLIALFSAVLAHYIETQTGIPDTTTQTCFWICAALMLVVGLSIQGERVLAPLAAEPLPVKRGKKGRKGRAVSRSARGKRGFSSETFLRASLLSRSLAIGLILVALSFGLITHKFDIQSDFTMVVLFLLVWLLAGAVAIADAVVDGNSWMDSLLAYILVSLPFCLLIFIFHFASLPPAKNLAGNVVVHYVCFAFGILAIALSLLKDTTLPHRFWQKSTGWLYAALIVAVALLVLTTNLNLVRADVYFKAGQAMLGYENWDLSFTFYKRAIQLAPGQDRYRLLLGRAYSNRAMADANPGWFQKAQEALEQGQEISPLDPEYYANFGELHQRWASLTVDPEEATERLELALDYYRQAASMSLTIARYLESATMSTHLSLANAYADSGRIDDAIEELEAARELAPASEQAKLDELITGLKTQE